MHKPTAVTQGIPGFFESNPRAWLGGHTALGVAEASYYSTAPLRRTLSELIDFSRLAKGETRLALGAVNVCSGRMRYFDSRDDVLGIERVMASGLYHPHSLH